MMHKTAYTLLWIGGLNWGLVGLFNYNLVYAIFGTGALSSLIYILVGVSFVYIIATHKSYCEICSGKMDKMAKKGK